MSAVVVHPLYGPSCPSLGWVPAPRYILRRQRVLALLRDEQRGDLLEVGCGGGALVRELAQAGYRCVAVESSARARIVAKAMTEGLDGVQIAASGEVLGDRTFDYVLAFEVLEHIEDDAAAVEEWSARLRPGGRLMLSVPNHPAKWNASDVWGGHYRRYTSSTLRNVLETTGLRIDHFECYGYPLANALEPIRAANYARLLKRRDEDVSRDRDTHAMGTADSGVERGLEASLYPVYSSPPLTWIMRLFLLAQERFLRRDLGNGYIVIARKPG